MKRPDQDRFDLFARHFESVDAYLVSFCKTNNLHLEKNFLRQPSRVLKREGNPQFLIDFALSEHWLKMDFAEDMLHTITAIGYYELPDSTDVWKITCEIIGQERFSMLKQKLPDYLDSAARLIREWTPEIIMQKGQRSENLKRKYGG